MKKPLLKFYINLLRQFCLYVVVMVGISTILDYSFDDTRMGSVPDQIGFGLIMALFALFMDRKDILKDYHEIRGTSESGTLSVKDQD